jgi:hypothetical protein
MLGIDEETGLLSDAIDGGWTVYGRGKVTLYYQGNVRDYGAGEIIAKDKLSAPQIDLP